MTQGDTTIIEHPNGTFAFYAGMHKGILDLRTSTLLTAAQNLHKLTGLLATHWIPKYGKKQQIPGVIFDLIDVNQS